MKKILVVDNHPVILKLLLDFLETEGHEVVTAEDGLSALELLKSFSPDIVFTDLIMPNISGEKLCQVIRSRPELSDIFIIVYSASVVEAEPEFADFGAHACIAKGPFKNTEKHVRTVIEHIDNGTTGEIANTILGSEEVYKRRITSELLFSKRHYEIIFDSMPEGVVEFTFDFKIFHANAAAFELCGIAEENLLASNFLDLFKSETRSRIHELLINLHDSPAMVDERQPVILNGSLVSINFLPIRDGDHEFIVAIMRNLTEKKETEKELNLLKHQQERILNAVAEGVIGVDQHGVTTFVNPSATQMLGLSQAHLIGNNLHEIVHHSRPDGTSINQEDCPICCSIQDGISRKGTDFFFRLDGSCFPISYACTPVVEDYDVMGAVLTFSDITARKKYEEKLRKTVITDSLTGLFNRRGFMTMADQLIKISVRDKIDLLLMYIDFDNMKWINDNLGHATGDQALVEVGVLLRDTFRQADIIARIGGDEFVVLFTDTTNFSQEKTITERLCKNVASVGRQENRRYPLSISFGLARYDHDSPCSMDELLSDADRAMYKNKEQRKKNHKDGYKN